MVAYETFRLIDALQPRAHIPYLVHDIIPAGSITIWYGYPGSLKSALVMDMCMAICTGKVWLPAMPNTPKVVGFPTTKTAVLWIDLDNGNDLTCNRVAAFARAYQAPLDSPFLWMAYPTPTIRASNAKSIASLYNHINQLPEAPKVIVIDTLLRAAYVKDENSSEMDTVLNNIHKMGEDLKATIVMISHSKKENTGRAANGLRGHSSIEGGVDAIFQVKREPHSDRVDIENQKARRKPVDTFAAKWTFATSPDGDLEEARFYFEGAAPTKAQQTQSVLCQKIIDMLTQNGSMNTTELFSKVGGSRMAFKAILAQMVTDGKVNQSTSSYHTAMYSVP